MCVVSFTPQQLYLWDRSLQIPLDRRLGGPHSQSGHGGEEKKIPAPAGDPTLVVQTID